MKPESSFGSPRKRRHEKAEKDNETQHALWVQRLREIIATENCTAFSAMNKLSEEVDAMSKDKPQRKQQIQLCWSAFNRRIREAMK